MVLLTPGTANYLSSYPVIRILEATPWVQGLDEGQSALIKWLDLPAFRDGRVFDLDFEDYH